MIGRSKVFSIMVKSCGVVGGLLDYIVSFLGQVIVIVMSRPRSLTITQLVKKIHKILTKTVKCLGMG